jgi:hypothetical protein
MKVRVGALALWAAVALAQAASAGTQFLTYDGRDAVQEGQGGNKKVVDGVDFWMDGTPPHRYQILGEITDERWRSGLVGLIQMGRLDKDIARMVHEKGGDAVLLADEHDRVVGVATTGFGNAYGNRWGAWGSSSAFSAPMTREASRFIVVKYLPDAPSAAGNPAAVPTRSPPGDPVARQRDNEPQ